MKTRLGLLAVIACFALLIFRQPSLVAEPDNAVALTGQVTSAEEGPMEGVLVSARKAGSTVTTTVISDRQGHYEFPRARLEPGEYAVRIRAIGYELESAITVPIRERHESTADLKLRKASDIASQLTNAEWLASMPGTPAEGFDRLRTLPHVGAGDAIAARCESIRLGHRTDGRVPAARVPADAAKNSFTADRRRRGAGRATAAGTAASGRASEQHQLELGPAVELRLQDAPPSDRQRHSRHLYGIRPAETNQTAARRHRGFRGNGLVRELRRTDPRQARPENGHGHRIRGAAAEAGRSDGHLGMRFDHDQNLWLALQFQGGIAKFDRKTEKCPASARRRH